MLGLEETLGLGVTLLCYTATLGLEETLDLEVTLLCYAAMLRSSWRRWDLGVLLRWGSLGGRWTSWCCYAGTLLRWGPRGDAGTSGYCYAGGLDGPRGYCYAGGLDGPRGYCYAGGVEETMDLRRLGLWRRCLLVLVLVPPRRF